MVSGNLGQVKSFDDDVFFVYLKFRRISVYSTYKSNTMVFKMILTAQHAHPQNMHAKVTMATGQAQFALTTALTDRIPIRKALDAAYCYRSSPVCV